MTAWLKRAETTDTQVYVSLLSLGDRDSRAPRPDRSGRLRHADLAQANDSRPTVLVRLSGIENQTEDPHRSQDAAVTGAALSRGVALGNGARFTATQCPKHIVAAACHF
jgi:hypothetical protein